MHPPTKEAPSCSWSVSRQEGGYWAWGYRLFSGEDGYIPLESGALSAEVLGEGGKKLLGAEPARPLMFGLQLSKPTACPSVLTPAVLLPPVGRIHTPLAHGQEDGPTRARGAGCRVLQPRLSFLGSFEKDRQTDLGPFQMELF